MSGARRGPNQLFSFFESPIAAIGDTITIDPIDTGKPHCFAGVQFFADANGDAQAIPTVGSVTIEILTLNTIPVFEAPPEGTIDVGNHATISWAANTLQVRAVPTGLDVATHYRLVVTCNET